MDKLIVYGITSIVIIWGMYFSYSALLGNFKDWKVRKDSGENILKLKFTKEAFLLFLVLGFFVSFPFLLWIRFYGNESHRFEDSLFVYAVSVALFIFFRK